MVLRSDAVFPEKNDDASCGVASNSVTWYRGALRGATLRHAVSWRFAWRQTVRPDVAPKGSLKCRKFLISHVITRHQFI